MSFPEEYKLEAQKLWTQGYTIAQVREKLSKIYPGIVPPGDRTVRAWRKTQQALTVQQAGGKISKLTKKRNDVLTLQTEILEEVNENLLDFQAQMRLYIKMAEEKIQESKNQRNFWDGLRTLKDINQTMFREFRETKAMIARLTGAEAPQKNINLNVDVDSRTLKSKISRYEEEGLFSEC